MAAIKQTAEVISVATDAYGMSQTTASSELCGPRRGAKDLDQLTLTVRSRIHSVSVASTSIHFDAALECYPGMANAGNRSRRFRGFMAISGEDIDHIPLADSKTASNAHL